MMVEGNVLIAEAVRGVDSDGVTDCGYEGRRSAVPRMSARW